MLPLHHTPNEVDYSKRPETKEIIGEIKAEIGEVPPAIGRSIRMSMMVPYCCIILLNSMAVSVGRIPKRIFSPSRGKTGTRLKIARPMFMEIST